VEELKSLSDSDKLDVVFEELNLDGFDVNLTGLDFIDDTTLIGVIEDLKVIGVDGKTPEDILTELKEYRKGKG
jgi:hypothetical protein